MTTNIKPLSPKEAGEFFADFEVVKAEYAKPNDTTDIGEMYAYACKFREVADTALHVMAAQQKAIELNEQYHNSNFLADTNGRERRKLLKGVRKLNRQALAIHKEFIQP